MYVLQTFLNINVVIMIFDGIYASSCRLEKGFLVIRDIFTVAPLGPLI